MDEQTIEIQFIMSSPYDLRDHRKCLDHLGRTPLASECQSVPTYIHRHFCKFLYAPDHPIRGFNADNESTKERLHQ